MSAVATFELARLSNVAGAEIHGIDLAEPLSATAKEEIEQALLVHHVLVFRRQQLTKQQQLTFTQHFGELENHVIRLANGEPAPLLHVISNLDGDGNPTAKPYSHGNYYWHTDKSYHAAPSFATLLHAVELPPTGGDTQYANMHRAYDALPAFKQAQIAELQLVHSWEASRINTGNRPASANEKRDRPPVRHPLVRTHPVTGRKSLYLGSHVSHVDGFNTEDSKALLTELHAFAEQDAFIYAHQWRAGDLVMWDNRCLLHRATANFEMDKYRRVMHRTVIKGTIPQ